MTFSSTHRHKPKLTDIMKQKTFFSLLVLALLAFVPTSDLMAQVSSTAAKTRGNSHRLIKDIPIRELPEVRGDGKPTLLYVVQLARFEDMDYIPSTFPKGTFLWASADHPGEKILYAGYYASLEEARKAAVVYKKQKMFQGAFPVNMPFIVRYD